MFMNTTKETNCHTNATTPCNKQTKESFETRLSTNNNKHHHFDSLLQAAVDRHQSATTVPQSRFRCSQTHDHTKTTRRRAISNTKQQYTKVQIDETLQYTSKNVLVANRNAKLKTQ
jgi:hypothetical protein